MKNTFEKPGLVATLNNVEKIEFISIEKNIVKLTIKDKTSIAYTELISYPDLPTTLNDSFITPNYFDFLYNLTSPLPVIFLLLTKNGNEAAVIINQSDLNDFDEQIGANTVSIFDCTKTEKVGIAAPGVLNFDELKKVIDVDFEFDNTCLNKFRFSDFNIITSDHHFDYAQYPIIVGTKESLKASLGITLPEYFTSVKIEQATLINLGSQTNIQNVAKNLHRNLSFAASLAGNKAVLSTNWGQSYWGKYIDSIISEITKSSKAKNLDENEICSGEMLISTFENTLTKVLKAI